MIIFQTKYKVTLKCDKCAMDHTRVLRHYNKMKNRSDKLFDKDYCNKCWRSVLNARPEYRQNMSNSVRMAYSGENGSIYKNKISAKLKGKINLGDKNGMKRPEVRAKVSATRSKMMLNPSEREKYRQSSIDAHARGVYIGTKCGQTKWYDYKHSNGQIYKVQGTWELKYIKWLDENNIEFECHKGRIPYIDKFGISRNYYPDFYLIKSKTYIDVKGDFWYYKSKDKFDLLFDQYPNLSLVILRKAQLKELGIEI